MCGVMYVYVRKRLKVDVAMRTLEEKGTTTKERGKWREIMSVSEREKLPDLR